MREYTNSEIDFIINEWIHSEKERKILHRRLVDGLTIEECAEEYDRTPRQMQRILNKLQTKVFLHL